MCIDVVCVTWGNMRYASDIWSLDIWTISSSPNFWCDWNSLRKSDLNPTTGHGWVDKLKLTQDLYYPCINKQLNQSKIMIFFLLKVHITPRSYKKCFDLNPTWFSLEVSRNVQVWRHFGTPFVLVLSRKPHENGKELWRLRPVWRVLETFLQFTNWNSSLKVKHGRKMCFIGMQRHWRRPKERDIRKACMHFQFLYLCPWRHVWPVNFVITRTVVPKKIMEAL